MLPRKFFSVRKKAEELKLPVVGRMNNRLGIEGTKMDEVHHLHGVLDVVSPGYRMGDVSEWLKAWKKKFSKERVDLSVRMAQLHDSVHVPSLVGVGYLASKKSKKTPRPKMRLMPTGIPRPTAATTTAPVKVFERRLKWPCRKCWRP